MVLIQHPFSCSWCPLSPNPSLNQSFIIKSKFQDQFGFLVVPVSKISSLFTLYKRYGWPIKGNGKPGDEDSFENFKSSKYFRISLMKTNNNAPKPIANVRLGIFSNNVLIKISYQWKKTSVIPLCRKNHFLTTQQTNQI